MQSYITMLLLSLALTANVRILEPMKYGVNYQGQVVKQYVYDENMKQFILKP